MALLPAVESECAKIGLHLSTRMTKMMSFNTRDTSVTTRDRSKLKLSITSNTLALMFPQQNEWTEWDLQVRKALIWVSYTQWREYGGLILMTTWRDNSSWQLLNQYCPLGQKHGHSLCSKKYLSTGFTPGCYRQLWKLVGKITSTMLISMASYHALAQRIRKKWHWLVIVFDTQKFQQTH